MYGDGPDWRDNFHDWSSPAWFTCAWGAEKNGGEGEGTGAGEAEDVGNWMRRANQDAEEETRGASDEGM